MDRVVLAGGLNCGTSGALLRLKPRNLDERLLKELVGPMRAAATEEELCIEFGISASELQEWRRQGMPEGPSATTLTSDQPEEVTPTDFFPPNARCCEVLRATRLTNFDPNMLTILLGGQLEVPTQAEVARAFGVSVQTVKTWVGKGMPKPAKSGQPYSLINVLYWRSREDERADDNQRRHF
jgi:DNA-binding transcriptional regulator YiaG